MARKNANSSPGVWLALLVLVTHTLAQSTRLEPVTDGDFPKNEADSENDSRFLQNIPPLEGLRLGGIPIIRNNVRKTTEDNAEDLYSKTKGSGGNDLGKSMDATERNSANASSDETVKKTTVDENATTVKTTPAHTTLPEIGTIPTIATIDFEKHSTTIHGVEAIEKSKEESGVESARVQTNRTGDAIIEESRNEKVRDSEEKSSTTNHREFEISEEPENFEEHTSSEFAEGTTPSSKLIGVERQKIVEDFHKNTERFDTEQSDDRHAGNNGTISLVNDTNVNYQKHLENGNKTNTSVNYGGVNLGHEPKHEVEIFKNVTHPSVPRISEDTGSESVADNTTPYYPSSRPRGRTISITGDNDLSSEKPKNVNHTNVDQATSDTVMRIFPKKSGPTEKPTELKPYPYLKSESKFSDDQPVTEIPKRDDQPAEEISAYENTIGRKKSDEKIIVTEPSLLVENSIQQFKPVHHKRSGNSSRVNSTFDTPVASTAWSLGADGDSAANIGTEVTGEPQRILPDNGNRSQINNDVPQDNPDKSSTTAKSPVVLSEVTENNIEIIVGKNNGTNNDTVSTPISIKLIDHSQVTVEDVTQETLELTAGSRVSNSTEKIETVSNGFSTSNEIQTGIDDAKVIQNQFKVTEGSTEHPLTPANLSTSIGIFATSASSGTENVSSGTETTVSLPTTITSTTKSTQRSPSGKPTSRSTETKSFDENVSIVTGNETISDSHGSTRSFTEPTTTVEYKFVELTTTEIDPTISQSDVTSSEKTNTVTNLINETSVATETQERVTTDGSIEQNETTVSGKVETGDTDEPPSQTTMSFDTTTPSSDSEVTTSNDQSNTTNFPVSETSYTDVYTDTTPSRSSIDQTFHGRVDVTTTGQSDDPEAVTTTMVTETEPSTEETTTVSNIEVIVPSNTTLQTTTTTAQSTTLQTTSTSELPDFTPSGNGVTLFVRIVIDGSWSDVCQVLDTLRQSLAKLLTEYTERTFKSRNIILYQTQCTLENNPSTAVTQVLLYVVDDNGDFDYSMTEILPSLYKQSSIAFPLAIHSVEQLKETEPNNNAIAVVAVSSVAFICLVLLAGLLFIMRKRQTRFNYGERCRPVSLDAYRVDSVSAYNSVRRKGLTRASKRSYGNPAFEDSSVTPTHPLNFAGLSTFCNDSNAITNEYSGIPQVTARMDELPAGAEVKNRYANVAPLPETRVLLQKINNEPLTEYINASYVRGPKNATKYYIACQAPMESTVSDFWRMIWEQQSKVIIMLTDIVENGVEKCVEYIPPSEVTDCHRLYGDYQVTLKKREAKEKYAISTLHLKNLENNTYREVSHIWYLWPTEGVPSNGTGLIAVLLEARALQRGAPGPIVVHCSPGTGRTGTLIALDLGIRQYEITRVVDVPRVVYTIRRDRAGAVQTKEQYAFIYKALNLYAAKLAGGELESM